MLQSTQTTNDVNLFHSPTGGGNVWRCDAMLEQQRGMSLAFVFFLYLSAGNLFHLLNTLLSSMPCSLAMLIH